MTRYRLNKEGWYELDDSEHYVTINRGDEVMVWKEEKIADGLIDVYRRVGNCYCIAKEDLFDIIEMFDGGALGSIEFRREGEYTHLYFHEKTGDENATTGDGDQGEA